MKRRYASTIIVWSVFLLFSAAVAEQKKVLIIESYHPCLDWTAQCEKGINKVLAAEYQIFTFYMDTKRIPLNEFYKAADAAYDKISEIKPDLIMVGDDNALKLLAERIAESKIPTVFFGINANPRDYYPESKILPDNLTGVLERLPIFPWIRHLHTIMPTASNALMLLDGSPTSDSIIKEYFHSKKNIIVSGISVVHVEAQTWEQWTEIIKTSDKFSMIILPVFHAVKDSDGIAVNYRTVIEWTSKNSIRPLFTYQDYTVGQNGAAGAYVIEGMQHGKLAAEIAKEILEGKKLPNQIVPALDSEGQFFFNLKQLERHDLTLPENIMRKSIFKD